MAKHAATSTLTIRGLPNERIQIIPRTNSADYPVPTIWEGRLGPDGEATLEVPRGYLVVIGEHNTVPVHTDQAARQTVSVTK